MLPCLFLKLCLPACLLSVQDICRVSGGVIEEVRDSTPSMCLSLSVRVFVCQCQCLGHSLTHSLSLSELRDHSRTHALPGGSLGRVLFEGGNASSLSAPRDHPGPEASAGLVPQAYGRGGGGGSTVVSAAHSSATDQERGAAAVPLSARSASSHMAGRFFDQTSTADKGRHRVHDARSALHSHHHHH